jgi:hypothetical protein
VVRKVEEYNHESIEITTKEQSFRKKNSSPFKLLTGKGDGEPKK